MKFSVINVLNILVFVLLVLEVPAQDRIRTLKEVDHKPSVSKAAPISIVSKELNNKRFTGESILAGPNWLSDLALTVKNVSAKPIVKFQILLTIAKKGNMENDVGMMFSFPQPERLLDAAGKPTGAYKELSIRVLQPDQTIRVQVWLHQLKILDDIEGQGVSDVNLAELSIQQVVFEDGSGWFVGRETREDPNNPKGQIFTRPDQPSQSRREGL